MPDLLWSVYPWCTKPVPNLFFLFTGRTAEELKAFLCQSDWWDHSFTIRKYNPFTKLSYVGKPLWQHPYNAEPISVQFDGLGNNELSQLLDGGDPSGTRSEAEAL